jgi:NAD(P)-dependent dehydrogenase (short-subunit alcohol dehydrogenase family)
MTSSHLADAKTALITGAAKRIGRAIALDMARSGWAIAIHYRTSETSAQALRDEICANGGRAALVQGNLQDFSCLDRIVAEAASALSPPTCLINNASEFLPDTVSSMDERTWNLHVDINLKAPVFLAQSLANHLPAEATGNIINIIDQRVWRLTPDFFSYTISKAGLWTATRTLAQGLAPRIRVNAIAPGPVLKSIHQTDADFEAEKQSILLEPGPTMEEVASAVRFILSSPSMTGQMIALDGGQHLS